MAIDWTDAELNAQADAEAARCPYVSIHTGDPAGTGALEATGGSPAYARKAANFEPAGDEGPLGTGGGQPPTVGVAWGTAVVDLPAGTYTDYGYQSAVTAGTFRGSGPIPIDGGLTLAAQGTLTVSIAVGPNAPA